MKIYLLLLIQLSALHLFAQKSSKESVYTKRDIYPKNVTAHDYNGAPSRITLESYDLIDKDEKLTAILIWEFNELGFLTKHSNYYSKWSIQIYEYEDTLLKKVIRYDTLTNSSYLQQKYIYNQSGAIEQILSFNSEKDTTAKKIYHYKSVGQKYPHKITKYSSVHSAKGFEKLIFTETIMLKYDSNNNIIEEIKYDSQDRFKSALFFKYESNYLVYEAISVSKDLSINTAYDYIRNSENQVIKRFETSEGKKQLDYINTYLNGNLIKREYYSKNTAKPEVSSVEGFRHNDQGDIVSDSKLIPSMNIDRQSNYDIKYDQMLNILTKKIVKTGRTDYELRFSYKYR